MAISRKPKTASENTERDPIYGEPVAQQFDDVDGEDESKVDPRDEQLEKLQKELTEMRTLMQERDSDLEYLRAPSWQSQTNEPTYDDPNKIELPDPALNPKEYADAVERRAELRIANKQKRESFERRRDDDLNARVQGLWADFSKYAPAIAVNNERVEYVAQKLAEEAKARGKDVEKYMFVTRKTFMRDLVDRYEQVFGPVEEEDADDDNFEEDSRPAPRRNARRASSRRNREEEDSGRSAGIFSGHPASVPGAARVKEEDGGMIADIQEAQKKSGFF